MSAPIANPSIDLPNKIGAFFHCAQCVHEWQGKAPGTEDMSPRDYQQIEAGWTEDGFQVWCKRHDLNIMHVTWQKETAQ